MSPAELPLLARLPRPIRKVVIVRASRIGDFLCATPAFRALRAALPAASIALLGLPLVREVAEHSSILDHFVTFPGFPGMAEQFFDPRRATTFLERMQAERFDLAIQMHGSGVFSNPFALLLGARATAGFIRAGDPPGRLDAALPFPEELHEAHRLLALTTALGAPSQGDALDFPLWAEDVARARALLAGLPRPLIGFHPSARDAVKRWPVERFAEAASRLQARHGGTVVLLGGSEAREAAAAVRARTDGPAISLAGETSLPVTGAVIRELDVLVTNDSAPAHIGYAVGTPTVTIFGGTDPRVWGPLDQTRNRVLAHPVACRPCFLRECPIGYVCLEGVTVEDVVAAAEDVMLPRSVEPAGT